MAQKVTPVQFYNPYKFRASRNAAANTGNGAFAVIAWDTEQYDTNNNLSAGVYTVPVTGYYHFSWQVTATLTTAGHTLIASLFADAATSISRGTQIVIHSNGQTLGSHGSDNVYLTAGQTVDIRAYASATAAIVVGNTDQNYFSGFLVSTS